MLTNKRNANNCSKLLATPEKSASLSPISKKQTLPSNTNIDFHIDNGLKNKNISEVNEIEKGFFNTDNNQIKDNKTENLSIYANSDR